MLASLISGKPPLSLSLKDKQLLFMQNILDPGILFITHANVFFPQGTFFSSKGSYVNPNGNIVITDIGEGDCEALLCYTDLLECCQDGNTEIGVGTLGEWFYPNGSVVGTRRDRQEFYVDRGPSVVRLNRRSNATSTTGWFCCVVPDVTSTRTRICVNVHVAGKHHCSTVAIYRRSIII